MELNKVYNMDNLELLKEMEDESIDLIYCDILYNTGKKFKDYDDNLGSPQEAIEWYKPRLIEMKRVLKNTGSIVLHCDHNLNSYSSKSKALKVPVCSDTLLWYAKTDKYTFHMPTVPYDDKLMSRFRLDDNDGKGKYYWADLKSYSQERLELLKKNNEVKQRSSGRYSYKRYFSTVNPNKALSNIWDDINRVSSNSKESCDYFSQKPKELLKRIINMLSNDGDVVADFFCGAGTSLVVAKELNRKYLGCDINPRAIEITNRRLEEIK